MGWADDARRPDWPEANFARRLELCRLRFGELVYLALLYQSRIRESDTDRDPE
jgi:hypothetical protein